MCGYFCIGFIDFMLNGNSLTDFTNLFSPNDFNFRRYNFKLFSNISLKWLHEIPLSAILLSATPLKDLIYIRI